MSEFEERIAWDMYFASVLGLQFHPANPPATRMSPAECARVADDALVQRRLRCLLSQLQSSEE